MQRSERSFEKNGCPTLAKTFLSGMLLHRFGSCKKIFFLASASEVFGLAKIPYIWQSTHLVMVNVLICTKLKLTLLHKITDFKLY